MAGFGLLGEKLSHSFSPQIHNMLGDYSYDLFETEPHKVEEFIRSNVWDGLNVTIPYKKTVFQYLDAVSEEASEAGCVNTVIRRNEKLYGDNTDIYGFRRMVLFSEIPVKDSKALVLGSGGASAAVCIALGSLGCTPVVISRNGPDNYENLERHYDAQIIVNTTPVGMYPHNGEKPLDLSMFPDCRCVYDVVYNPLRTELLLQAEKLGIANMNGLYMLVAQAKRSAEIFTGESIDDREIHRIYKALDAKMRNIILIGMPGCGKSTAAQKLSQLTGRKVFDTDEMVKNEFGITPEQMILQKGEKAFRAAEHEMIKKAGKTSNAIISTGGGIITVPENYDPLHQNGIIVWLKRDVSKLSTKNRPLSASRTPEKLFEEREPLYRKFADHTVDMDQKGVFKRLLRIAEGRV